MFRISELKTSIISLCLLLISFSSEANADGRNGGEANGSVSVTIDNSVICEYLECIVMDDAEVVQPYFYVDEQGVHYVYRSQ